MLCGSEFACVVVNWIWEAFRASKCWWISSWGCYIMQVRTVCIVQCLVWNVSYGEKKGSDVVFLEIVAVSEGLSVQFKSFMFLLLLLRKTDLKPKNLHEDHSIVVWNTGVKDIIWNLQPHPKPVIYLWNGTQKQHEAGAEILGWTGAVLGLTCLAGIGVLYLFLCVG